MNGSTALTGRTPLADVIHQHVEDAAFCWAHREQALWSPGHTPAHLGQLDHRLDANLEGIFNGAATERRSGTSPYSAPGWLAGGGFAGWDTLQRDPHRLLRGLIFMRR